PGRAIYLFTKKEGVAQHQQLLDRLSALVFEFEIKKPPYGRLLLDASQPVECALQNIRSRVLIDNSGTLFSAHVRFDHLPFDSGRGQTLIPKRDRKICDLAKVARESSRRLCARAF